ncbi:Neopullulanase [Spiroplasma clarkii]|uniref:alpha amylase N-terminal ig-like domain-containing protein n=1 Tax=Spiroplasma clarkii TaxID=2139 RepID=UPI000B55C5D3|nr:alpha amylase N-terminal ig-like domain-containing protein [Spiroplasma clarkii]ARU90952.1 Neopullulanase [Spiroplasma clarkii]
MIERTAILHVPKSNFAYAQDQDNLHIILKAKHNDLKKVTLFYSDPFDFNDGLNFKTVIMEKSGETSLFDYYKITIAPKDKRATYFLKLRVQVEIKFFILKKDFLKLTKRPLYLKGVMGLLFLEWTQLIFKILQVELKTQFGTKSFQKDLPMVILV